MKNMLHQFGVSKNLFTPNFLIFQNGPEAATEAGPAKQEVNPYQESLKGMEAHKDDPEALAADLEKALVALEAEYAGKSDGRIADGSAKLTEIGTAMGATPKEQRQLVDTYNAAFAGGLSFEHGYSAGLQGELAEANKKQQDSALVDLQGKVTAEVDARHGEIVVGNDARQKAAVDGLAQAEKYRDYRDDVVDTAEDKLGDAEDTLADEAKLFGLPKTEQALSAMNDEAIAKKIIATRAKEDPNFTGDNTKAEIKDIAARRIAILREKAKAVQDARGEIYDAKQELKKSEALVTDWKTEKESATKEGVRIALAYKKDQDAIADGTYGEPPLNEQAETLAADSTTPEEQALLDRYAEIAKTETKELLRGIAFRQLKELYEKTEENGGKLDKQIAKREASLESTLDTKQDAFQKVARRINMSDVNALGLTNSPAEWERLARKQIDAGYREEKGDQIKDYSDPQIGDKVDLRYGQLKTASDEVRYAYKQTESDAFLVFLRSNKEDNVAVLARIDGLMKAYSA